MKSTLAAIGLLLLLASVAGWLSGVFRLINFDSERSIGEGSIVTIASTTASLMSPSIGFPTGPKKLYTVTSSTTTAGSDFVWVPVSQQYQVASHAIYFVEGGTVFTGGSSLEYPGYALPGADPTTLLVLLDDGSEVGLAKDKAHVYVGAQLLPDADPDSITPMPNNADGNWDFFFADKDHVYYFTYEISGADPHSFSELGTVISGDFMAGIYAKDAAHVYYIDGIFNEPFVVAGADTPTFRLVDEYAPGEFLEVSTCEGCAFFDARDARNKYSLGQIVQ